MRCRIVVSQHRCYITRGKSSKQKVRRRHSSIAFKCDRIDPPFMIHQVSSLIIILVDVAFSCHYPRVVARKLESIPQTILQVPRAPKTKKEISLQMKLLQVLAGKLHTLINLINIGTVSYRCRPFAASLAAHSNRHGTRPFARNGSLFAVFLHRELVKLIVEEHSKGFELTSETKQP